MLLYYITDGRGHSDRAAWLLDRIGEAAVAGVDYVQLREKDLEGRQLLDLARAAVKLLAAVARPTRLLINDRLDLALAAGAHGVHLPAEGLPIAAARRLAPPGFLIFQSCHSAAEVMAAATAGADGCVLGPIYATPSKEGFGAPLGLEPLRAARAAGCPVLALGGVTLKRAAECAAAGASGIAGIRLFQDAPLAATCAALRRL